MYNKSEVRYRATNLWFPFDNKAPIQHNAILNRYIIKYMKYKQRNQLNGNEITYI